MGMKDSPVSAARRTRRRSRKEVERVLARDDVALGDHSAHLIRRAHQRASMLFHEAFQAHRLTPTQYAVLGVLLRLGQLSQRELGEATAIDTASLSPMLSRLTDDGLVRRVPSSRDQRVNLVDLTNAGVEIAIEGLPLSRQVSEQVLAPLTARERDRFMTLLGKLG